MKDPGFISMCWENDHIDKNERRCRQLERVIREMIDERKEENKKRKEENKKRKEEEKEKNAFIYTTFFFNTIVLLITGILIGENRTPATVLAYIFMLFNLLLLISSITYMILQNKFKLKIRKPKNTYKFK